MKFSKILLAMGFFGFCLSVLNKAQALSPFFKDSELCAVFDGEGEYTDEDYNFCQDPGSEDCMLAPSDIEIVLALGYKNSFNEHKMLEHVLSACNVPFETAIDEVVQQLIDNFPVKLPYDQRVKLDDRIDEFKKIILPAYLKHILRFIIDTSSRATMHNLIKAVEDEIKENIAYGQGELTSFYTKIAQLGSLPPAEGNFKSMQILNAYYNNVHLYIHNLHTRLPRTLPVLFSKSALESYSEKYECQDQYRNMTDRKNRTAGIKF